MLTLQCGWLYADVSGPLVVACLNAFVSFPALLDCRYSFCSFAFSSRHQPRCSPTGCETYLYPIQKHEPDEQPVGNRSQLLAYTARCADASLSVLDTITMQVRQIDLYN